MNFDYGNLLTRTLQITWKHKVLWGILALPILLSMPVVLIMFGYIFILQEGVSPTTDTILSIVGALLFILFFIASMAIYAFSSSAVTLGVIRAEKGSGSLNFMTLLKDGLPYFWRQLGLFFLFQLSIFTAAFLLSICMFATSMLTMGLSSICLQPFSFLLIPLMFLSMGVLEAACTAVVEDDSNTMDALKRGLLVVREHVWKYVLITFIIYIVNTFISSLITFPLFMPFFFLIFNVDSGMELGNLIPWIVGGMVCLFLPIMTIVSVISQTFMKTCLTLTYLRLTQPAEEAPVQVP